MRRFVAEVFGTFTLVFAGTGAIIANDAYGGSVTHVGIALTFGLVVLVMIYAIGDVSGAHMNPAVTIGFYVSGRFEARWVAPYIVAQFTGALLASLTLKFLFRSHSTLGATLPADSTIQAFILEFILTLFLMVVILSVATGAKEKGIMAGVAIGSLIALEALFAGPVSGASMNPARSLGPAVMSLNLTDLWVYLTAPVLGACAGVLVSRVIQGSSS